MQHRVDRIILASPRGFCAGVEMAIKALAWMVRTFPAPVYCYHEIVHNKTVVERFQSMGVIFVDDIADVPPGSPVMLSAHGSAPQVVESAHDAGRYAVDAVCPLVTKVHHEVKVRAGKGYRIVYVGHEGHEEAVGTMAVAPQAISRVETIDDVASLPAFAEPVALLAQTTLSHRDWKGVADAVKLKFPQLWSPGRSDLCFATTNRQSALMEIASKVDTMIVVGSANSSNTVALAKLAKDEGCPRVLRINSVDELTEPLHGVIGLTAGASAPDEIVSEISQETGLPQPNAERTRRDAEPADPLTNFFRTLVILTPGWTFGLFSKALAPALYPTQNRTTREAHQEPQLSRGQPMDIPTVPSWIFTINELLHPSINATLYSETEPARTTPDPSMVTPETTEILAPQIAMRAKRASTTSLRDIERVCMRSTLTAGYMPRMTATNMQLWRIRLPFPKTDEKTLAKRRNLSTSGPRE